MKNCAILIAKKMLQGKRSIQGVFALWNGELQTNLSKTGQKVHHLRGVWFQTVKQTGEG
jgi:hypothetical protein